MSFFFFFPRYTWVPFCGSLMNEVVREYRLPMPELTRSQEYGVFALKYEGVCERSFIEHVHAQKRSVWPLHSQPLSSRLVLYSLAPLVPPGHLFTVQTQFGETATTQNADFWQVVLIIGVSRFSFPIWSLISSLCQHLISPYFQPAAVPPPLLLPAGRAQPCKSHSCIDPAAAVQNRCLHRECARPAPLSCTGRLYTPV